MGRHRGVHPCRIDGDTRRTRLPPCAQGRAKQSCAFRHNRNFLAERNDAMPGVEHGDHCLPCSARQLHQTKHAALTRAACFVQKVTGTSRANWCRSMRSTVRGTHRSDAGLTSRKEGCWQSCECTGNRKRIFSCRKVNGRESPNPAVPSFFSSGFRSPSQKCSPRRWQILQPMHNIALR